MKYFSIGPALLAAGLLFCTLLVPLDVLADSKKDELSSKQNQAQQAYNEAGRSWRSCKTSKARPKARSTSCKGRVPRSRPS